MTMLEKIRNSRNLTRQELSNKSGVSVRTIESYEQRLSSLEKAQINILDCLAYALKTRVPALIGFKGISEKAQQLVDILCCANEEDIFKRKDITGDIFDDETCNISCVTGQQWFGDSSVPFVKRMESTKKYVYYMMNLKNDPQKSGRLELFAGTMHRYSEF